MKASLIPLEQNAPPVEHDWGARHYIDLNPTADARIRKEGELVMANGVIKFDTDTFGWIVGIEFVEMDPCAVEPETVWEFIQDKNPLKQ